MRRRLLFAVVAAVAAATVAASARAAFPGANGRIAFSSNRSGNFEIWTVNPDGSGLTNLTNNRASDRGPAWSPDGTKIAFHSNRSGNNEIYVMNASGSGVTRLTNDPATDANPAWSPDGTQIAFESNRTGNAQIWIVNADGTGLHRLTNDSRDDVGPAWSPDGTEIAYGTGVACGDCANTAGNLEVHVINADGTNDRTLESEPANPTLPANTSRHPDWAPNGKKILFSSARSGALEVWVMHPDGSHQRQVTHDGTADQYASFSPDGEEIVYSSVQPGIGAQVRIGNLDGDLLGTLGTGLFPDWQSVPETDATSLQGNHDATAGAVDGNAENDG